MEQLTEFNAGGTHDQNQLGGIPQGMSANGQPNLVEEGETKLNASNYVFSDRLVINKMISKQYNLPTSSVGKTFAEVSKKLNLSNSRRENDSIEENDKKKNLDKLMTAQEDFKQQELEADMSAMMEKHPELATMMQQSYQPQQIPQQPSMEQPQQMVDPNMQQPQEQPMMAKGGYMYAGGGELVRGIGTALNMAAPLLSKIPGVGTVAGIAAGGIGAGLQNVGTGADFKEVAKDTMFGVGKGAAGMIPGGSALINGIEQSVNTNVQDASEALLEDKLNRGVNQFPDGGKLKNPHYKEQLNLYNTWNDPTKFLDYGNHKVLTGKELDDYYATETKNNPASLEKSGSFVGGYKPKEVYMGNNGTTYPVYNKPSEYMEVPPTSTSDVQVPFVKPVEQVAQPVEQPNVPTAYRMQNVRTIDPATGKWVSNLKSVPYYEGKEGSSGFAGGHSIPNPPIIWIDENGVTHNTQPQAPAKFAEGGGLDSSYIQKPFIGPQNYQQPVVDPSFNPAMQYPLNYDQPYPSTDVNTDQNLFDDFSVEEQGARMFAEEDGGVDTPMEPRPYQNGIQKSNMNITDNNQDLRVQQTKGQALAEVAPVAYNLGMGLFGKATNLNPDDYLKGTKIAAPEMDITPQIREGQQSYATAQNSIANSGVSGGAYLTNLQQLANDRNKNLGALQTNKENVDNQNKMQADQFNASMQANNNQTRFQIEDYNARAKAAKQAMLQEGLTQVADIGKSKTANQLATSYYSLNAPDFKGQVGYTSYFDYLKNKKAEAKANKNTNE